MENRVAPSGVLAAAFAPALLSTGISEPANADNTAQFASESPLGLATESAITTDARLASHSELATARRESRDTAAAPITTSLAIVGPSPNLVDSLFDDPDFALSEYNAEDSFILPPEPATSAGSSGESGGAAAMMAGLSQTSSSVAASEGDEAVPTNNSSSAEQGTGRTRPRTRPGGGGNGGGNGNGNGGENGNGGGNTGGGTASAQSAATAQCTEANQWELAAGGEAVINTATSSSTTITLGTPNRAEDAIQLSGYHGTWIRLAPATNYSVTFDHNLSTWDSYAGADDYWDGFSVSITDVPYPEISWTDPIDSAPNATPVQWSWGGDAWNDGIKETTSGTATITATGDGVSPKYLNVMLDTVTTDTPYGADGLYPSWGTFTITSMPAVAKPEAPWDQYAVSQDSILTVGAPGVLVNDTPVDPSDTLTALHAGGPFNGTGSLNEDGSLTYTPNPGYTGTDGFIYHASDGNVCSNQAVVWLHVFAADIDIDSDNDGIIQGNVAEDAIELNAPGKIILENSDDDNGNGQIDWYEDPILGGIDNDLHPISLEVVGLPASMEADYNVEVEFGDFRLWTTADKQGEIAKYTRFPLADMPSTLYLDGGPLAVGLREVSLAIYKNSGGYAVERDTVTITVVPRPGLTAYRPQAPVFRNTQVPESKEEVPGVGIRRNRDDDDYVLANPNEFGNGVKDYLQGFVPSEDDLIQVDVSYSEQNYAGVHYQIRTDNLFTYVWDSAEKSDGLPFLGGSRGKVSNVNIAVDKTLWVEWTAAPGFTSSTLQIEIVDSVSGNVAEVVDSLVFHPYDSIVVDFMGEFHAPVDPAPATMGIMQVAIDLRAEGYDVFVYNEPDNSSPNEEDYALRELKSAVERGQTKFAIMGYSHGGGSTYELSKKVVFDADVQNDVDYTIPFTAYVDAVQQNWAATMPPYAPPQTDRPFGSQYHLNQYQLNPTPSSLWIIGGPTSDGDVPYTDFYVDRTAYGVDHGSIDDHPVVLSFLKTNLRTKLPLW